MIRVRLNNNFGEEVSFVGAVSFSIDTKLVEQLKQILPLSIFVETGTFKGDTVSQVINLFEEIHTVELSQEYFLLASKRFQHQNSVKLYHDASERLLQTLCPTLHDRAVLYWLDAHWCVANATAGEGSQCPLLEELAAIQLLNPESVILIDDARLFLCTPPKPHTVDQWPTFDAILRKLFSLSSAHEVMVINDVIAYYPTSLSAVIRQYAHENSIDWLHVLQQSQAGSQLLSQLEEKEAVIQAQALEIQQLDSAARDRLAVIEQQQQAIEQIKQDKKATVQKLRETAKKRQQRIHQQAEELQQMRQTLELTSNQKFRSKLIRTLRWFH